MSWKKEFDELSEKYCKTRNLDSRTYGNYIEKLASLLPEDYLLQLSYNGGYYFFYKFDDKKLVQVYCPSGEEAEGTYIDEKNLPFTFYFATTDRFSSVKIKEEKSRLIKIISGGWAKFCEYVPSLSKRIVIV